MTIEKRISKARIDLLLDFPWFGALAMNLRIEQREDIPTFAVDGTTMFYNPKFAESLTDREIMAVTAHEVMHCALSHMYRRNNRDPLLWNIATDFAINLELINAGLKLPEGCLLDQQYKDLSAEVIYAKLMRNAIKIPMATSQPTGTVQDAPKDSDAPSDQQTPAPAKKDQNGKSEEPKQAQPRHMTEQDWKIATEQAAKVAKAAGKMPASLERIVTEGRDSKVDWRAELREFIEQTLPSDFSWTSPNRRHIANGLYLPGMVKEGFGTLAIAVDTSGSIRQEDLQAFVSELKTICSDLRPEKVVVMYCDAAIQATEEWDAESDINPKPKGGGGTQFAPVFEAVNKWEEPPKVLLYFSADLWNSDAPVEPSDYPVMWVTGLDVTRPAPFGKTLRIEA